MPEEEEKATARVTMLWPPELKAAVRERVGSRGLTEFVIEATKAKLGTHDAHKADSKELSEVKYLAQQLADSIAMGSDYADPLTTLQEIGLPDWIQTDGWTDELSNLVKPEDSTPEKVTIELVEHEFLPSHTGMVCERMIMRDGHGEDCGLPADVHPKVLAEEGSPLKNLTDHFGVTQPGDGAKIVAEPSAKAKRAREILLDKPTAAEALQEIKDLPKVGDPETIVSELPHDRQAGDDLLARIQAKAAEKGVDISGIDLKPASSVQRVPSADLTVTPAEDVTEPAVEANSPADNESEVPVPLQLQPDAATPSAEPASDVCPKCQSELVGDECWECM